MLIHNYHHTFIFADHFTISQVLIQWTYAARIQRALLLQHSTIVIDLYELLAILNGYLTKAPYIAHRILNILSSTSSVGTLWSNCAIV